MIIDVHAHHTTAPASLAAWRQRQLGPESGSRSAPLDEISDDELRASIEPHQLRLQRQRGIDMTLLSPTASAMGHHEGTASQNRAWAERCNDLVRRACALYPRSFAPVCQLPQSPRSDLQDAVAELRRAVLERGFVGCLLNPDPSGGSWAAPPLGDRFWYPLYTALTELDVPAMIHPSASRHPAWHTTASYYLAADTTAFVQLTMSDVFKDFPSLRVILPHGGGAVPYQWGRLRGLCRSLGLGELEERVLGNVFFDTCVYDQPGIDLLLQVIPATNVLFGSELLGAVRGDDPRTGAAFDDTRRGVASSPHLDAAGKASVFEQNARRVFPRLSTWLLASAPEPGDEPHRVAVRDGVADGPPEASLDLRE